MTVTHIATGSRSAGGTTTVAPAYPSGVSAGRLAVAARVIKPETATGTAESGWGQQVTATGGTGTTGADVGLTRVVVDTKELAGGESGSVTFDNASSPNSSHGVIAIYDKDPTDAWALASTSGSDATHGTARSATGSAISLAPGDVVIAVAASDTDTATAWTSPAITASGITFGATTERLGAGGVTTGNQCGLSIFEATVSSGTATAAPVLTLSGGPSNCGPVAFLRLREVVPPANPVFASHAVTPYTGGSAEVSVPLAKPSGIVAGSTCVVFILNEYSGTAPTGHTPPASGGTWTQVTMALSGICPQGGPSVKMTVFEYRAGPSETSTSPASTWTFTWTNGSYVAGATMRFTGASSSGSFFDPTNDFEITAAAQGATQPVQLTTPDVDRLLLWLAIAINGNTVWTPPGTFTEIFEAANLAAAYKAQAAAGDTGALSGSNGSTTDRKGAFLGSIKGDTVVSTYRPSSRYRRAVRLARPTRSIYL